MRRPSRAVVLLGGLMTVAVLAATSLTVAFSGAGSGGMPSMAIGGPFKLADGDGHIVTSDSFHGRWLVVYFGYTHCPDACPTALSDIATALDQLTPAQRAKVAAVFITVDPERDMPAVVRDYAAAFGAGIVGLTGPEEEIRRAEKGYHVYAAKHPTGGGEYEMDHSSVIYLMNPQGRFVASFSHADPPDLMADKLKRVVT